MESTNEATSPVDLESINEPGDVITESITVHNDKGESYDISNFCIETILFEDIFSNTLMGHILVIDAANLVSTVPFLGIETITVSFRTPTFTERISKSFKITAVDERMFASTDREQSYVISFISTEGFTDNITNISKKFSGTTDEVVKKVYSEYLATKRFVGSKDESITPLLGSGQRHGSSVSFVPCSWSPLKIINWVAGRSFGTATAAPTFMFFETNKSFWFTSIEELIAQQKNDGVIFAEYVYSPTAASIISTKENYRYVKPEIGKQYSIVRDISPFRQFDLLDSQDRGYYAGTLIVHDHALKTYQEFPFDYRSSYNKFEHLGKNPFPPFPASLLRNPAVKNTVRTKAYKLHNEMKDPLYEKWMLQRNSLLVEACAFRIKIEVAGRTDIEAGRLVNFLYPKAIDKNSNDQQENMLDPFLSGLYLITAIRHSFTLNKHTMYVELMKDSFPSAV